MNAAKMGSMQSALEVMQDETKEGAQTVKAIEAKHAQDVAYLRALILRYLEMESQHEALFPAIATYFKFTEAEVNNLSRKQEEHAFETSLMGRTLSAGSFLFGVAREAAQEVQNHNRG